MSTYCSEIADGTADQLGHVHRAHFFGIDPPSEVSSSVNARMKQTDAGGDARLARGDVMHIDPQILFTARWFDQAVLTPELQTP